ncbi:hypothetical protein J4Q44_G00104960 [Coregonus suidteri]|uniref:Uncharacterized protein n=1 Tax=Coregonus suidteri TaxID=861788 RepID=A0AAN8M7E9_9TELE
MLPFLGSLLLKYAINWCVRLRPPRVARLWVCWQHITARSIVTNFAALFPIVHMAGRTDSNTESCESLSADEEVPMKSSGSQSWSWGLKGIPCN